MTESQLLILQMIYDNESSTKYLYQRELEMMLAKKITNDDNQYLALLIKGLQNYNLLSYESADIVFDGANQWHMRSSKIANEFFDYLSK